MPRYDYYCQECDKKYLLIHDWNKPQKNCTVCNSDKFTKLLSPIRYVKAGLPLNQRPAGSIVKETIEETKTQLKKDRAASRKRTK